MLVKCHIDACKIDQLFDKFICDVSCRKLGLLFNYNSDMCHCPGFSLQNYSLHGITAKRHTYMTLL